MFNTAHCVCILPQAAQGGSISYGFVCARFTGAAWQMPGTQQIKGADPQIW